MRINNAILAIATVSLFGCGSDQLPVGSSLKVFPNDVSWTIAGNGNTCDVENGPFNDQLVTLSLEDAQTRAIGGFPVELSLDLSGNTFSGAEVLSLIHDANDDGIYSADEKVSVDGGPIFTVNTGSLNGEVNVVVRVNLSCSYRGTLYAFAGSSGTLLGFTVTEDGTVVEQ